MLRHVLLRFFALTIVMGCGAMPAQAAHFYESYARGEKALGEQRWDVAVDEFLQAINDNKNSKASVRTYGMHFIDYFPYLQLGIAYYNMGAYDEALRSFDLEEGFGEVEKSIGDFHNLQTFRRLVTEAKQTAAQSAQERIATVVAQSLEAATILADDGKFDDALAALSEALAVQGTNEEVLAAQARLNDRIAEKERKRQRAQSMDRLMDNAKSFMDSGDHEAASSALSQALVLNPDHDEAKSLLSQIQSRIRQETEAQNERQRLAQVEQWMQETADLESGGDYAGALQRLQSVLAVDPVNAAATQQQARLATAQTDLALAAQREEDIVRLMLEGEAALEDDRLDDALSKFGRVVALDPGNDAAKSKLAAGLGLRNLAIMARRAAPGTKMPPNIVVTSVPDAFLTVWTETAAVPGAATDVEARTRAEKRTSSGYDFQGVIVDDRPQIAVMFTLFDAAGEVLFTEEMTAVGDRIGSQYAVNFSHRFKLPAARSRALVQAVDLDGLSAEAEHWLEYVPPLTRRWWFWASLGGGLVLLSGIPIARRTRRRSQFLKRKYNPFIAGAPILDNGLFLGRERLVKNILNTIHNNSILLYGERRIGKTSLQHHLKRRLQNTRDHEFDFYPVYIDLQGTPQERFFATLGEEIFDELGGILNGIAPDESLADPPTYTYRMLSRDIRKLLKELKKKTDKNPKVILLIDEVDELNDYDPRINQKLRALFMTSFSENLGAVVSGVQIKKRWESEGSPWYNFFEEIEVKPFSREDAEELIRRPVEGVFDLEDGVTRKIIDRTGCKPYLIQKFCMALVNRAHQDHSRRLTLADVDRIGSVAVDNVEPIVTESKTG